MPSVLVRLTPAYYDALKTLARREHRSLAAQVRLFLDAGARASDLDPETLRQSTPTPPRPVAHFDDGDDEDLGGIDFDD
jgi:hypothetical protein